MKNKNGFIFMETIVVVSVLSITLLLLFTSYSYILRKTRERNVFNTSDSIYKAFNINEIIRQNFIGTAENSTLENILKTEAGSISSNDGKGNYTWDLSKNSNITSYSVRQSLDSLYNVYGLKKIYYIKPFDVYSEPARILKYDATTIDFIRSVANNYGEEKYIYIFKIEKCYEKDETGKCVNYEVFHASLDK